MHFLTTIKRNKTSSIISIFGLSLAFATFFVIFSQVLFDITYNFSIKDADRIYQAFPLWDEINDEWSSNCPGPVSFEAVNNCPGVEMAGQINFDYTSELIWKDNNGEYRKYNYSYYQMDQEVLDIIQNGCLSGVLSISEPNTVVISDKLSKILGVEIGDHLWLPKPFAEEKKPTLDVVIKGVYRDFAKNSDFYNMDIIGQLVGAKEEPNNNWNHSFLIKFRKGYDTQQFVKIWQDLYSDWYLTMIEEYKKENPMETSYNPGDELQPIKLISLNKVHYANIDRLAHSLSVTIKSTITLIAIAMVIVIIAFINYINFFIAKIPSQLRSVNIKKVFGASRKRLIFGFLIETICYVLIAILVAMLIISLLKGTVIESLISGSLSITDNIYPLLIMIAVCLIMACIAVIYPALYITKFNPSLAVKQGFAQSVKGRTLRSILIITQFVATFILIILSTVFFLQFRYMVKFDMGFDRENLLTFTTNRIVSKSRDVLSTKLQNHPDIIGITQSSTSFGTPGSVWGREKNEKRFFLNVYFVNYNFLEVMGIPLIEGEGFKESSVSRKCYIATKELYDLIDLKIGGEWENMVLSGVCADTKFSSIQTMKQSYFDVFVASKSTDLNTYYVKTCAGADIKNVISYIQSSVSEIYPTDNDVSVEFVDKKIEQLYGSVKKQSLIITLFSLIAILISIIGLFGVVLFETKHRCKEIALRKVVGSTSLEIMHMINKRYIYIVLVSFIISTPISYFILTKWLSNFPNRVEIGWSLYAIVLVSVLILTVIVISIRTIVASNENPVISISSE